MAELNNHKDYNKLFAENKERLKELSCINRTSKIIKENKSIEETLQKIVLSLPQAWQYPENTVARIKYEDQEYITPGFEETRWFQKQSFTSLDGEDGSIEVHYTKSFPDEYDGPFLKEEHELLNNLANLILGFINSYKAKEIIK